MYRHFAVPFFAACDAFEIFSDWTLWRILPCYFSKALPYWRRQKMNPNIQKIDILCNVTNKKFARHFENHRCTTWRHTGSDQWTNVYPRDGPSLLIAPIIFPSSFSPKSRENSVASMEIINSKVKARWEEWKCVSPPSVQPVFGSATAVCPHVVFAKSQ